MLSFRPKSHFFFKNEVSHAELTFCFRYMSRVKDLAVLPDSLFLGPHETHLQFFVWKEVLQSIKAGEEYHDKHAC